MTKPSPPLPPRPPVVVPAPPPPPPDPIPPSPPRPPVAPNVPPPPAPPILQNGLNEVYPDSPDPDSNPPFTFDNNIILPDVFVPPVPNVLAVPFLNPPAAPGIAKLFDGNAAVPVPFDKDAATPATPATAFVLFINPKNPPSPALPGTTATDPALPPVALDTPPDEPPDPPFVFPDDIIPFKVGAVPCVIDT